MVSPSPGEEEEGEDVHGKNKFAKKTITQVRSETSVKATIIVSNQNKKIQFDYGDSLERGC